MRFLPWDQDAASSALKLPFFPRVNSILSAVTSVAPRWRAVATRIRSAGSACISKGRRVLATAISGSRGTKVTPGLDRASRTHTITSMLRFSLPFETKRATSQGEIALTATWLSRAATLIARFATLPSLGLSSTDHTNVCVSSNSNPGRAGSAIGVTSLPPTPHRLAK